MMEIHRDPSAPSPLSKLTRGLPKTGKHQPMLMTKVEIRNLVGEWVARPFLSLVCLLHVKADF